MASCQPKLILSFEHNQHRHTPDRAPDRQDGGRAGGGRVSGRPDDIKDSENEIERATLGLSQ